MPRSSPVLADTHALLWWKAGSELLSATAVARIDEASHVLVSPISCWEIGMLVAKGKVALDRSVDEWVADLMSEDRIEEAPITPAVAVAAALLPDLHGDPADRLLVSTAVSRRVPMITKDRLLHRHAASSESFSVIW